MNYELRPVVINGVHIGQAIMCESLEGLLDLNRRKAEEGEALVVWEFHWQGDDDKQVDGGLFEGISGYPDACFECLDAIIPEDKEIVEISSFDKEEFLEYAQGREYEGAYKLSADIIEKENQTMDNHAVILHNGDVEKILNLSDRYEYENNHYQLGLFMPLRH